MRDNHAMLPENNAVTRFRETEAAPVHGAASLFCDTRRRNRQPPPIPFDDTLSPDLGTHCPPIGLHTVPRPGYTLSPDRVTHRPPMGLHIRTGAPEGQDTGKGILSASNQSDRGVPQVRRGGYGRAYGGSPHGLCPEAEATG